jgi:hypothetical protein
VRTLTVIAVLAAALSLIPAVSAHDFSTSYSRITAEGPGVKIVFTLNLLDLHQGPQADMNKDGFVSTSELEAAIDSIVGAFQDNYRVEAPEPPIKTKVESYGFLADNVLRLEVLHTFNHDVTDLRIVSSLDRITQADHRNLLQIGESDNSRQGVLDATSPRVDIDLDGPGFFQTVRDFVVLGMEHIVTGYDHLAFLIGLLVTTTTMLSLVKVVTSFTVAHSITLALATFNIVSLPPRLIESLIALSIAYVAIENFTGKTLVHRWKITFLFGLVHGFGFSNILREMELSRRSLAVSLFSFNAGVEIGQLIFVCAVFPLVFYLTASRWKEQFLSATSLTIMSLGFYWFVQRAFLA